MKPAPPVTRTRFSNTGGAAGSARPDIVRALRHRPPAPSPARLRVRGTGPWVSRAESQRLQEAHRKIAFLAPRAAPRAGLSPSRRSPTAEWARRVQRANISPPHSAATEGRLFYDSGCLNLRPGPSTGHVAAGAGPGRSVTPPGAGALSHWLSRRSRPPASA